MTKTPGSYFSHAARGAFRYLRSKIGFEVWMVTRVEGENWIVLDTEDPGQGVGPHTCFRWADSLCSRMVAGEGPRVAPDVAAVPAYASARVVKSMFGQTAPVRAYVGVPLTDQEGALFGTLCAVDRRPQPESVSDELPTLEIFGMMLSSVLSAELRGVEAERGRERAPVESELDKLTDLMNKRGWDRLLAIEEQRCRRYGNPACVVMVDLDGLPALIESRGEDVGEKLIRRAGKALRKAVREADLVARLGAGEFGVLGVPANAQTGKLLAQRLRRSLEKAGVSASVGMSSQVPATHLEELGIQAGQAMRDEKVSRQLKKTVGQMRRVSRSQTFPIARGAE